MPKVNLKAKEIKIKIVYYGPGRSGKTTNLEYIHTALNQGTSSKMVTSNTEGDRTLFFDFLPMGLGKVKGFDVRLQLFTVPGQVKYASTRKMVLRGADGVIFVADSLKIRREKNMLSLQDMHQNLRDYGMSIFKIPLVIQYNKRDLPKEGIPVMTIEQMQRDCNRQLNAPYFPASAIKGQGVAKTLKACLKLTLQSVMKSIG